MLKVSQKQMCYIAAAKGAKRFGKDISHYEAILSSNERIIKALSLYRYDGAIDVQQDKYGYYAIEKTKELWCEGLMGCSGEMHFIKWIDLEGVTQWKYVFFTNLEYKF